MRVLLREVGAHMALRRDGEVHRPGDFVTGLMVERGIHEEIHGRVPEGQAVHLVGEQVAADWAILFGTTPGVLGPLAGAGDRERGDGRNSGRGSARASRARPGPGNTGIPVMAEALKFPSPTYSPFAPWPV